jgi:hypothetical protein
MVDRFGEQANFKDFSVNPELLPPPLITLATFQHFTSCGHSNVAHKSRSNGNA